MDNDNYSDVIEFDTTSPWDELVEEKLSVEEENIFMASNWKLMRRRFFKHKLAVFALVVIGIFYSTALFCEFFAPYDPGVRYAKYLTVPPQRLRFIDAEGKFHIQPFVYKLVQQMDMETLLKTYTHDTSIRYPLRFFVQGDEYKLWGLFKSKIHLFGVGDRGVDDPEARIFLFGTDIQGRDVFSRIIYGGRISLTIGLVGIVFSFFLGLFFGGLSGYFGGVTDIIIQRIIEVFRSIPGIPLWMGLAAAIPVTWPVTRTYFAITVVLSFLGWVGLARVVRGKFRALKEEDYITAAVTSGCGTMRVIWRHMVPAFTSHIIASITLAIPGMILGETALSFLGIGMRSPAISWGVLLKDAQNATTISLYPWLMIPGVFVIIIILSFNFMGDGLRDAADPYGN